METMKPLTFLRYAALALSLAQGCRDKGGYAEEVPAWYVSTVQRIVDGDTLILGDGTHESVTIRLKCVDAPEKAQPFGKEATAFTEKLCLGKQVQCQIIREHGKKFDKFGRYVALVRIPGKPAKWLNDELVAKGFAQVDPRYTAKDDPLFDMQAEAKASHKGLWKDEHPIEPWKWRKGIRE